MCLKWPSVFLKQTYPCITLKQNKELARLLPPGCWSCPHPTDQDKWEFAYDESSGTQSTHIQQTWINGSQPMMKAWVGTNTHIQQIRTNLSLPMQKAWLPKFPTSEKSGQMVHCLYRKHGHACHPHLKDRDVVSIIRWKLKDQLHKLPQMTEDQSRQTCA